MSAKFIAITGLSLAVGLGLPDSAAGVTISAGGNICISGSGVSCSLAGSSSIVVNPGSPTGSTSTVSSGPFAGITDFAVGATAIQGTIKVTGGPTFRHVNALATGKTGSTPYMVISDSSQGIVLVSMDPASGVLPLPTGTASAPTGVVVADLDGDGNDDIIAVDGADDALSVMFGRNDGSFAPPVLVPLASKPTQFVLADIDGDGHPDLLVPDAAAGTLDVYLNDGHGGFAAATPKAAGSRPLSIAGADLDGNGHVDLVVGNGDDSLSVLLNDGHGNFSVTHYGTDGVNPDHLYLGTMLASPVFISVTDAADDAGAYFQGNGDGTFQPAILNSGGDCATTICATATPVTSGTTSKPGKPAATAPASGGGGDLGLFSLILLGLAGFIRRLAR